MRTPDAPTHSGYSHVRIEECVITNVNRKTWTVTAESRHSAKTVEDIQVLAPYHHYSNGEGIHHLPEVGAICVICWLSDNTPPFIMGYLGAASVTSSQDDGPERSTAAAEGSPTDVSFQSRRPDLNPGDIAMTTRDGNFIYLRRGGVIQIGATSIAQRIYIPVLNYIKDFCENYEMSHFGGDLSWTVARSESDASGKAPATYILHLNEFAQDKKATVRISHLPVPSPGGGSKAVWEVKVAPQGIDRDDGSVTGAVYSLLVTMDGKKTEIIGADRSTTIKGNDLLDVTGDRTLTVGGTEKHTVTGDLKLLAGQKAVLAGLLLKLGSEGASEPGVKGQALLTWFASAQWVVAGTVATLSPASLTALSQILSQKVFLE